MSAQLAAFEEDRKQYQEQLDIVRASLKDDPGNAELLGLKAELDDMVKLINESIAELKPKQAAPKPAPAKKAPSPPRVEEKWSRENHPAFKKAAQEVREREQQQQQQEASASAAPVSYQVNDTVLAKWVSGDKGFYPGRITSVTGSSTAPIYTVKFKSYDTVETLRAKDIRPVSNKRKADGSTATTGTGASGTPTPYASASNAGSSSHATPATQSPSGAGTPTNGIVLQAQPSVYPHAEQAKAGDKEDAPVKKFKKIKANKELEAGKSKWQDFNNKSKFGKAQKKDSMFRTPEGAHGRVGFTGSGQPMRKDPTRSRHIYQQNEDFD